MCMAGSRTQVVAHKHKCVVYIQSAHVCDFTYDHKLGLNQGQRDEELFPLIIVLDQLPPLKAWHFPTGSLSPKNMTRP